MQQVTNAAAAAAAERERMRVTLFSLEDAEAMNQRERTRSNAAMRKQQQQYRPPQSDRSSSYTMRPSQTLYMRDRDEADGTAGSGESSLAQDQDHSEASTVRLPSSARRMSAYPDVGPGFDDMFETDWEGYVWKQGHVVRSWRYRYAILSGTTFSCTSSSAIRSA